MMSELTPELKAALTEYHSGVRTEPLVETLAAAFAEEHKPPEPELRPGVYRRIHFAATWELVRCIRALQCTGHWSQLRDAMIAELYERHVGKAETEEEDDEEALTPPEPTVE